MNTDVNTPDGAPNNPDGEDATPEVHVLSFGQRMRAYFFAGILVIASISPLPESQARRR